MYVWITQEKNYINEYGLGNITKEKAISYVDLTMKTKSISCVTSYSYKTGDKTIGKGFFDFLTHAASYDQNYYFVKEVRKKLKKTGVTQLMNYLR